MTGLHDPAWDIIRPHIQSVGYDPKDFGSATDLESLGGGSPLMVWTSTMLHDDGGLVRSMANVIAKHYQVTATSKKGAHQHITFVHRFAPGQREFTDEEVREALLHLVEAREHLVDQVGALAFWAAFDLGSSSIVG